jgi:hypothetical protein
MNDWEQPLSPAGQRCRERILQLALHEARQRRQQRWTRRSVGTALVITLALVAVRFIPSKALAPQQDQIVVVPPHVVAPTPSQPKIIISRIETDPTIVDRLAIRPSSKRWQSIGDDELLAGLADAGKPAGLIHIAGHTVLLPQTVAQR